MLAEYAETSAATLAHELSLSARLIALAVNAGPAAGDHDLRVMARIPVVLAARAAMAAGNPAPAHAPPGPPALQTRDAAQASRDDSGGAPTVPATKGIEDRQISR
ncbi:hypothetical protein GCM10010319_22540 [Streptomyces blastmyceticus]|uniref:Uncharacterized protein n=1 Tax=Streptomyces blastmyceticus TaxID=68180 RepID=A0ABN0WSJ0_9ACTN